jgi:O-6-methylguanine DNA methyltransferase
MSTEHELATLFDPPAGFAAGVLARVGLGDWAIVVPGTPAGDLLVAYNDHGVSAVGFDGAAAHEALERSLGRTVAVGTGRMPARLRHALDRTIATGRVGALPIDLRGLAAFRRSALLTAARIPPGEVRSYGWIARELGSPSAARAVGSAMATNRIPVVLPCHRVVPSDGSLGAYGGGVDRKAALLRAEGVDVGALADRARRRIRYVASTTTGVYCLPTCHTARRITPRHLVELADEASARAQGLRPCRICRP